MKIKPFLSFALFGIFALTAAAQTTKAPLDEARLAQLKTRMRSFVEQGRTAGIVTLLGYRGQVIHADAVG